MANQDELFNLGESEASSYLTSKKTNDDGLLRPKLEEGKDGKRELVIRLLPNMMKSGKVGPTAMEKHIHYADFKNNPDLQGYFDCLKNANIGKDCPLCKTFWALKNSKNPAEQDKAKLINRSTKYYAYAYVVEDKQKPDNEGKIFIFPFGFKIFQKIKAMAESTRKPCIVEDLIHGANLVLKIEEVGGFYNYDGSMFEAPEPITFGGKQLKVDADGKISAAEKTRVVEFLKSREHDLDEFVPLDWTPEQYDKANKIIALLSGQAYDSSSASASPSSNSSKKPLTSSAVFADDDDDDEDETPAPKAKKSAKPAVAEDEDDEDEAPAPKAKKPAAEEKPASDANSAKKKAKAFFGDDEDN